MRKLILALMVLLLSAVPVAAAGLDVEMGQQFAPTRGAYLLLRYNWQVADISILDSQVWILPEAGVISGWAPGGYGRVQVLLDTPVATFGMDSRAGSGEDCVRFFVRFDL